MEPFDFDSVVCRRGTRSYKWDTPETDDLLPMWVADMDFRTAPVIIDALRRRVEHGIFGYTKVPDAYYDAVTGWFARRHGWHIDPGHMLYTTGVVPALSAVIKALTQPGDKVLVQTPVYNCFFSSIRNNGCTAVEVPLICRPEGYRVDFEAFEQAAADPAARLFVLCNPHNPVGRVWSRGELEHMGRICRQHGLFIVSDEIHCELTFEGHDYTPFGTLPEAISHHSVSCISPSKAFNTAGLQMAAIVAPDAGVRQRIDRAINDNEVCDVNPFGIEATIAAYNEGEAWLDALRSYLWANYLCVAEHFRNRLPAFRIQPLEGSYLLWIEIRATGLSSEEVTRRLADEARLMVSPGTLYGAAGEGFIRLNIACPRTLLEEGLRRLDRLGDWLGE